MVEGIHFKVPVVCKGILSISRGGNEAVAWAVNMFYLPRQNPCHKEDMYLAPLNKV